MIPINLKKNYISIRNVPDDLLQMHPVTKRGSVLWCNIPPLSDSKGNVFPGQIVGDMPCVLMKGYPMGRMMGRLQIPVVPLSGFPTHPDGVSYRDGDQTFSALTARARTVDPEWIELDRPDRKPLSEDAMATISQSVLDIFQPLILKRESVKNDPGTRLEVSWNNARGLQEVVILSVPRNLKIGSYQVTPVYNRNAPAVAPNICLLPAARINAGKFLGKLSRPAKSQLFSAIRTNFRLPKPAGPTF